jgi:hypothetical protein
MADKWPAPNRAPMSTIAPIANADRQALMPKRGYPPPLLADKVLPKRVRRQPARTKKT